MAVRERKLGNASETKGREEIVKLVCGLGRYLRCSNAVNSNAFDNSDSHHSAGSVNEFSNPFPRTDICHSLILKKQFLFTSLSLFCGFRIEIASRI